MNDKVLQAISDALPETQVKMVKDALVERDSLKEELTRVKNERNNLLEQNDDNRMKIRQLEEDMTKISKLNSELYDLNNELVAKDVENRVVVAEAKLEVMSQTTDKFLKNTIYRESLQHQVVDETPNIQPNYVNGQYNGTVQSGTNKVHKPVIDTKERTAE